ncbi:MAG: LacI family DNA-binding transcriptional regulator [Lachnospiraceae bacterium]|nr:LacI family DNA-binding transcriptional regulator [Lachnospiraceae bacterium]
MTRITIQDIAKEMGLSRNTVSLALKGSEVVSSSTRQRVYEYAMRVGFFRQPEPEYLVMILRRPNDAAFWDKIMSGIMKEAREENCLIQVGVILEEDIVQSRFPIGYKENVDAFLFLNVFPESYVELLLRGGKTGIFLDGDVHMNGSTMPGDMVKSEGIRSTHCMTQALIDRGLRRIEFLSCDDVEVCQSVYDRLLGYQQAMEEAGLPMTTMKELQKLKGRNVYNLQDLNAIMDERTELPEAFVCSNDVIAGRVIQVLRKRGVRVPEDVAVTGFDNTEEGDAVQFITTADFSAEWLGRRLVMQMLWRLRHPEAPHEVVIVDSKVIFRNSSAGSEHLQH